MTEREARRLREQIARTQKAFVEQIFKPKQRIKGPHVSPSIIAQINEKK